MFENPSSSKIVLFEYGAPVNLDGLMNYCPGVWKWCLTPGVITFTDDQGTTGYYSYTNAEVYQVTSLKVDNEPFTLVTSIADLLTQDEAFYYDSSTKFIYIAFYQWEPPLSKVCYIGATYGFSKGSETYRYNNIYYEPRLTSAFGIKKSKDPLFYGMLKFNNGTVKIINTDGEFDDFGDRDLFRAAARILVGEKDTEYSDFVQTFSGLIGNYSNSWTDLQIKVEDIRSGLTQPVPPNKYSKTDYTNMSDDDSGKCKPIAYGVIYNAPCVCLNAEEAGPPATYTFHFMDTEFNAATALTAVYVDGAPVAVNSTNLSAGTFTLTSATVNKNFSGVTADFTGANISNGVEIIKDLMKNYANTEYIAANYDLTETAAAVTAARNTSCYIKDEIKLNKAIEQICVDIDALFFAKDNGLYSVRIYDSSRASSATILKDDWIDDPKIENNTDEFLSSVIVKYYHNQNADSYRSYNNTTYESDVYDTYKSKQSKEIQTELVDETAAIAKSEVIMSTSKQIADIVTRSVNFSFYALEIMDFVTCDPKCRRSAAEAPAIWEVIGINKNLDSWKIELTLRYVKAVS
jgi:hypothetical protein